MGNISSLGDCLRRRKQRSKIPPAKETTTTQPPKPFVFSPATPYNHHHVYQLPYPVPYVEHKKVNTIHNNVNLKEKTLRLEPDPENPSRALVSFTFDANVSGRITVVFFAEESEDCKLIATKEETLPPITFEFEKGLGQKFIQPCGTGVNLSLFEDSELLFNEVDRNLYPLAIKGEGTESQNAEITLVEYVKEEGEVKVRVLKQILWVNGLRYELNEIYGMRDGCDEDDTGNECTVCLSEPRDTVVLPCRHMCMCNGCAKVLRFQTNLCPVCKEPAERLMEIGVCGKSNEGIGDENEQKLS